MPVITGRDFKQLAQTDDRLPAWLQLDITAHKYSLWALCTSKQKRAENSHVTARRSSRWRLSDSVASRLAS